MSFKRVVISSTVVMSLIALAGCGSSAGESDTASPSEFFGDNDMTIIVPYGPGTDTDSAARLIAEHLGKHFGTSVGVSNVEGGGALIGMNTLADSDPDGLTLGYISGVGLISSTLSEAEGINFEAKDLSYVATMSGGPRTIFAGGESGLESWQDVLDAGEFRFASSGVGGADHFDAVVLQKIFPDLKFDIVTGMTDGTERSMTVIQGALDGMGGFYDGRETELKEGKLNAVLTVGSEPLPAATDIPVLATDFDLSEEAQAIVDAHVLPFDLNRIIAMPPNVPADRLDALRQAFDEIFQDEDFIADLNKIGQSVQYLSGEETHEAVQESLNAPAEYVEILKSGKQ